LPRSDTAPAATARTRPRLRAAPDRGVPLSARALAHRPGKPDATPDAGGHLLSAH